MTPATPAHFTLEHNGQTFAVETASAGLGAIGRLFVDGVQADEQKSKDSAIHLDGGGLTVVVSLNWMDQVKLILAVPSGTDPKKADEEGMVFEPPAGSHAARLAKMKREHPELYAARHVAVAVLQVLIGALGIGALLSGLLPRIGVPDFPLPDLPAIPWPDLPDIPWPDVPWPVIAIPDIAVPDWIGALWSSVRWLVPIVIAVAVALNEIEKRRKRDKAEAASRQEAETARRPDGETARTRVGS